MATPLANYQTAYQMITDQIVMYQAMLFNSTDDVQSYSIEGQTMTRKDLMDRLDSLLLKAEQMKRLIQMEGGAFQVHSYGVPW